MRQRKNGRRGYGKKNKRKIDKYSKVKNARDKSNTLSIMGVNANGLSGRTETLQNNINFFLPSIVTIQETKYKKSGKLQLNGYQAFERVRGDSGGGITTFVDVNLDPILLHIGDNYVETMTVEVNVGVGIDKKLRIIDGYGPQEHADRNIIANFWEDIEEQIVSAKSSGSFVVVQIDANAKVGDKIIKNDPHTMTSNGKTLIDLVERQNLIIGNATEKCSGKITRERNVEGNKETSIIDYIIVCEDLYQYMREMVTCSSEN